MGTFPAALIVRLIGGPTALIELGGLRLLTDPTFDPPGDHPIGRRNLVKTTGPAIPAEEVGRVDAVLLSHDQHPDNLDDAGRRFLDQVPLVLSTAAAEARLGGTTRDLPPWTGLTLPRPDGGELRITGVPAQHGPAGSEYLTGEVRGFVLSGEGLPRVYVSGDNASLAVVSDVADHAGPIDVAILFAGHARSPLMDAYLTLGGEQAVRAAEILAAPTVIPIHVEGWRHLTEGMDAVVDAFARRGLTDRLLILHPGDTATVESRTPLI
ncbi:MBL fold metallo-hydrolase [Nonomuraea jiangxiensis]|uniref:L-ascorbate metabolism protein UlaG, beta-lactamase superfamily n=1 Tax=Nonomuraea jiangxiensis TaxID=633440 RepID=A0A1G9RQI3_9ACTN|nr:MBL fold metallo-hydrolase [Nonomuraea jiangxiensis]SDM25446.1 L-ascorbate metabolism protein UlaG, beta-lactamase superfamily [Nonomuraea jiangxiensis]